MDKVIIGPASYNPFGEVVTYYLFECPDYIEEEVWGNVLSEKEKEVVNQFHFTWACKLQEVCQNHSVEILSV
ncbi:hypothetical protein SAMN04487895_101584 [Paenibacillus sophorae]|uniref:Uncharacterized protein n=1 Tax=Paenibacillus sophorae TaxID=1333845 RepID=A0A1H8GNU5_9BACL|nr:hypothetical protein [Paenibacillus sophorae]QWU14286.1 hypothetical protein KP014_20480 [Paenibacillus sophorae]SEN45475.1 hypothetical protein SAMN04487895_101584 [Paenibacillus sophorae]